MNSLICLHIYNAIMCLLFPMKFTEGILTFVILEYIYKYPYHTTVNSLSFSLFSYCTFYRLTVVLGKNAVYLLICVYNKQV